MVEFLDFGVGCGFGRILDLEAISGFILNLAIFLRVVVVSVRIFLTKIRG